MKKYIALLLCLIMALSLLSCNNDVDPDQTTPESSSQNEEETAPSEQEISMEMYLSAIRGEIDVIDNDLGSTKLQDISFPSDNMRFGDCYILYKYITDLDGDGIDEFIIQSENQDHIILRYYQNSVYSYCFESNSFRHLNTDGSFYWRDGTEEEHIVKGCSRISFDGATLITEEIYSLRYTVPPYYTDEAADEYYLNGEKTDREGFLEYYNKYGEIWTSFSPLDISCEYPISAEDAYNIAVKYWRLNSEGEGALGTTIMSKAILLEKPYGDSGYYRIGLKLEHYYHHSDGWESGSPHYEYIYKELLVDAFTGETIIPSDSDGEG